MDNQLRRALTGVCEIALKEIDGFEWLTHRVDYSRFPQSLRVVCVFDSHENLSVFRSTSDAKVLAARIQQKLNAIGVKVKDMSAHIIYDSEENCAKEHQGNWAERLRYW